MQIEPTRFALLALYIGPDVLMPVASAIAAAVGFLLMFWHRTVAVVKRLFASVRDALGRKPGAP